MTEKMVVSRNTSINRLRDKAITDCKPTKVHVLADGGGLELIVKPIFSTNQASGEKVATSWNRVWSYRFIKPEDGKRTKMGLGNYPTVTLQRARELKRSAQELLLNRPHFPRHLKSLKLRSFRRCYEQAATLHGRIQTGRRQAGD